MLRKLWREDIKVGLLQAVQIPLGWHGREEQRHTLLRHDLATRLVQVSPRGNQLVHATGRDLEQRISQAWRRAAAAEHLLVHQSVRACDIGGDVQLAFLDERGEGAQEGSDREEVGDVRERMCDMRRFGVGGWEDDGKGALQERAGERGVGREVLLQSGGGEGCGEGFGLMSAAARSGWRKERRDT